MIRRNTKITFFSYLPYECTAVEQYLEQMAEKGWLLLSVKGAFFKFRKIEPKRIKYSVDILNKVSVFDHKDSDKALEYREYCKAAGWNYVCQVGKVQIFYTEDNEKVVSIHTDEEERFKDVFKYSLYNIGVELLLILLFIFNIYNCIFMVNTDFALSSNLSIAAIVGMLCGVFISSTRIINFFIWSMRAKRKLKENKFMPYNNYKQLRIKNILIKLYISMFLSVLLGILIFENYHVEFIIFLIVICIPVISMICVKSFINKKKYSKNTNMVINIVGMLVSIFLILMLVGRTIICNITETGQNRASSEKINLRLTDFGYKESNVKLTYTNFNKSVLAQRAEYVYDNNLSYTIFQSKYPWIVQFNEKRLLNRLNKYSMDLKEKKTNLPSNVRVYSDSKKKSFVLASEDKVVDIKKDFSDISDEEFLNKVYKKLFY